MFRICIIFYYLEPWYIMTAKIKVRYYIIFNHENLIPQIFSAFQYLLHLSQTCILIFIYQFSFK